jgi:hypothetical protein
VELAGAGASIEEISARTSLKYVNVVKILKAAGLRPSDNEDKQMDKEVKAAVDRFIEERLGTNALQQELEELAEKIELSSEGLEAYEDSACDLRAHILQAQHGLTYAEALRFAAEERTVAPPVPTQEERGEAMLHRRALALSQERGVDYEAALVKLSQEEEGETIGL